MMLTVALPDNCQAERRWICNVVLGEFLGLDHDLQFVASKKTTIAAGGKCLEMPDIFFDLAKDNWLSEKTLPREPLLRWTTGADSYTASPATATLPILYGRNGTINDDSTSAYLGIDVFGSAFFMLTRYEEAIGDHRDIHDRFPASASLAFREGFLDRPVIDEYVEVLWSTLQRLWPQLRRHQRRYSLRVTCDVDHPYHPSASSLKRLLMRMGGEALRKRSIKASWKPVRNYIASRSGDWQNDPYHHMVDWMMDVNEHAGNKVAFYFIPEITDSRMDDTCAVNDPAVIAMMRRIADRGHEIGIHPGYKTYKSITGILSGKARLQQVLDKAGIRQDINGGRQHYLRWATTTPGLWETAKLTYDSTLGYADWAGFRCGTCHEYPMFDMHARMPLKIRQRPLICMESSVIGYMGYGYTQTALDKMQELKATARKFEGSFTLLWHNSYLEAAGAREIYREVISS
jgi:hypothetical protein